MFGFGSSKNSAHRKVAQSARAARELAAREFAIELQMLTRRMPWAVEQRNIAFNTDRKDLAGRITIAISDGQELIDRIGLSIDEIELETSERWKAASSSEDYETLASYESDLRSALIDLRGQTKLNLERIGNAAIEVVLPPNRSALS